MHFTRSYQSNFQSDFSIHVITDDKLSVIRFIASIQGREVSYSSKFCGFVYMYVDHLDYRRCDTIGKCNDLKLILISLQ